ncbi:MAG: diacylglycerol kinase family lipid kinase [Kiritimatiellae bacterium]|nr:diacylglycerol kinase family lipid kinase [Kiritimatiellia bacterium]
MDETRTAGRGGGEKPRRVRVLINPKSGVWWSFGQMQEVLERCWDMPGVDLSYQFSNSKEDGQAKARRALDDGVDTILVVGGDGMVNSIGSVLVGHDVALGVIPAGSGNGFARHFGIPLNPEGAARALVDAERRRIDVGTANGRPFFVTCSMAWDGSLVRHFEKSPVRGVLPYVLAAAYELFEYESQSFEVVLDGAVLETYADPLVFTVANLTQFGGGAQIAPTAQPDDGYLELIVMLQRNAAKLLANLNRLFDGTINQLPEVRTRRFKQLEVRRERPAPIQVDGELVEADADVGVALLPRALTVLAPWKAE